MDVEFRAGKMKLDGRMLRADEMKGTIRVFMSPEDGVVHFTWLKRPSGATEDDFMLFPGDAVFSYVEQARNNAKNNRVYVLKIAQNNQRHFFYMQEPDSSKDKDLCSKLNARIGATVSEADSSESVSLQAPGQLDQRQLPGASGSQHPAPSSAAATAVAPSATATGGISAANLSAILAGIGRGAGAGVQRGHIQEGPSLPDVLEPRALSEALASLSPEATAGLLEHLPEGDRSQSGLREIVRSPQLAQAVGQLDHVLQSGQGRQVVQSFGLPPEAAGGPGFDAVGPGTVKAFLSAIQAAAPAAPAVQAAPAAVPTSGDAMDTDAPAAADGGSKTA